MDQFPANVLAHAMQALVLVVAGTAAERLLRNADARIRLALWQLVLAAVLLLPLLQHWEPSSRVVTGFSPVSMETLATPGLDAGAASAGIGLVLLIVLGIGAAMRAMWVSAGWIRLQRIRRTGVPLSPLPAALRRAARDVGTTAPFLVTPTWGPVSFGIRRPCVLLPESFSTLDERAQYLIARHELLHLRRGDGAQSLIEEAVLTVLWFQPWVWWARARIRVAREQVVDRAVLHGAAGREVYVRGLLEMSGHAVPPAPVGAAVPRTHELRERIDALYREAPMSRVRAVVTVCIAALGLAAVAAASSRTFPLQAGYLAAGPVQSAQEDEAVKVDKAPRKTKDVRPVYPREAKEAGIEGVVVLELIVRPDGRVKSVKVIESVPELDAAAVDAVLQWEFEPTYRDGKAVSVILTVTINFTLAR